MIYSAARKEKMDKISVFNSRRVGIPTYWPQFSRLLASEGFSPIRQSFRVPKKAKKLGSFLF